MLSSRQRRAITTWFLKRQRLHHLLALAASKAVAKGLALLSSLVRRCFGPATSPRIPNKPQLTPFADAVLTTERLRLHEVTAADMDRLAGLFPSVPGCPGRVRQADQYTLLREVVTTYATWVVTAKDTGAVVGYCGLTEMEIDGQTEHEVGYRVGDAFAGRGYATEAARAVMEFAFRQGLPRLVSVVSPENTASARVARKNGMTLWKRAVHHGEHVEVYAGWRGTARGVVRSSPQLGPTAVGVP